VKVPPPASAEDLGQVGGVGGLDKARGKPLAQVASLVAVGDPGCPLPICDRLEGLAPRAGRCRPPPSSWFALARWPPPLTGRARLPLGAGVARRTLETEWRRTGSSCHPEVPMLTRFGLTGDAISWRPSRSNSSRLIGPDEAGPMVGPPRRRSAPAPLWPASAGGSWAAEPAIASSTMVLEKTTVAIPPPPAPEEGPSDGS